FSERMPVGYACATARQHSKLRACGQRETPPHLWKPQREKPPTAPSGKVCGPVAPKRRDKGHTSTQVSHPISYHPHDKKISRRCHFSVTFDRALAFAGSGCLHRPIGLDGAADSR